MFLIFKTSKTSSAYLPSLYLLILLPSSLHQGRMSSGHRQRDVEQQHPLLDREDAVESFNSKAKGLWFIQDCCGMVCAFITWLLVFFADFVVTFVMLLPSSSFCYAVVNGVVFNLLAVLALASHLRTMLTDPVRGQNVLGGKKGLMVVN